ncbi:MAG: SigB/SigF/SigG family RNA polymerase sigma factor [Sciscionella sp.]
MSTRKTSGRGHYDHLGPLFTELAGLPADDPRRAELRDRLVTEHLPVARNIAAKFRDRHESPEDLNQVAAMALVKAVDRFDPEQGADFMSFAVPTMVGEVRKHFRDTAWAVRVPRPLKERQASIAAASTALAQQLGRAATASELAAQLGISRDAVIEGLQVAAAQRSSSLDEMLHAGNTGVTLADTLGEDDAELSGVENRETLRPLLDALPDHERTVLVLRFFKNLTQTEIAERIGVSQMQVSRLLAKALGKLRDGLRRLPDTAPDGSAPKRHHGQ